MISTLLMVTFGVFLVAAIAFKILFFLVVLTYLGDRSVRVKDSRWGFLVTKWPVAEMAAYKDLLPASERRRWYNWYLFHARKIVSALGVIYISLVVVTCSR